MKKIGHNLLLPQSLKLALIMALVVFSAIGLLLKPRLSGAFFTSSITAFGNRIMSGDWTPPSAPLFWVEEDSSEVLVEWTTVADAVNYRVYRSTDNVSFSLIATQAAPASSFVDTSLSTNTEYFYLVRAVDAASNESTAVTGKRAFTKDIVIDDSAMDGDHNSQGSVSSTGAWSSYHVGAGGGVADILQNAVGGDNFSTTGASAGQTHTWQTNAPLDGQYEVFSQYICDASRGNAEYSVFADAGQLNPTAIVRDQSKLDGVNAPDCGGQANTSIAGPTWVSLGTYSFFNQTGRVVLTAPTGEINILADAVAFQRVGDAVVAPVVDIDREAIRIIGGQACGIGSAISNDSLRVVVTNWQPGYKLQLRYKVANGSYNSFVDASTFGMTPAIVGNTATFEYANTGNSTPGLAGWQAQVVDSSNVQIVGSNIDEETYYITTDAEALACNGSMQFGFETDANELSTADYGSCPVTTADASRNGGQSSVQILKWSAVDGAVKYHLYGHSYTPANNGSISYSAPYPVVLVPGTGTVGMDKVEISPTNSNMITYDTWATGESTYAYYIEALDGGDNVIGRTTGTIDTGLQQVTNIEDCTFTVDRPAPQLPTSSLTVSNTPAISQTLRAVQNRIQNGSFESDLANWNVSGDVELIIGGDAFTTPHQGTKMVKIGKSENEGNRASLNVLSQDIPAGVRSLGFYYNMFSYDVDGFDEPGFMVFVDNEMVYQRWANEIDLDGPSGSVNVDETGWEYIGLDLSRYPAGTTLTLAFYAGNDVDNLPGPDQHQTWVYVDNFSTNESVVNASSVFEITTNPGDTAHYRIGTGPNMTGNTFSLTSQPVSERVYYWSSNGSFTEAENSFHVLYDNVKPDAIDDLAGAHLNTNLFELNWLSPRDDNQFNDGSTNSAWYDIRYSTSPIEVSTDWNTLTPVTIVTEDGLPFGGYRAPRPENEQENYFVRVSEVAPTYYFAVRSYDAAGNVSETSNDAEVSAVVVLDPDQDIVLNEVLPNPTGDDAALKPAGEWVELYNKSSSDIDVNGWIITDDANNELVVSATNSDNNLELSDAGETVVPANGFLVVYRNGDVDFEINDASDTIKLYNGAAIPANMIDEAILNTATPENKSWARIPDGVGLFVDPVPTPGRANVENISELQPSARLRQQAPYTLKFDLIDAINYTEADYAIEYQHNTYGETQTEAITGTLPITSQAEEKTDLVVGTCSTGGECSFHTGVNPATFLLRLTLRGLGMPDRTITEQITGSWSAE